MKAFDRIGLETAPLGSGGEHLGPLPDTDVAGAAEAVAVPAGGPRELVAAVTAEDMPIAGNRKA